jgi:hypothetical protein
MPESDEGSNSTGLLPPRASTFHGRLATSLRRQDWAAVTIEVAVVVLGVAIGFQVAAWGAARSDAAREQHYLSQLASDLRETERQLAETDAFLAEPDRAGGQLWAAFYHPEPPPLDSLFAWRSVLGRVRIVSPVLGTAEALVATGDLSLVRDDALRSAILEYVESSRYQVSVQTERYRRWWDELQRLDAGLDPMEAYLAASRNSDLLAIREGRPESADKPGWEAFRDQVRNSGYPVPDTLRIRFPLNAEAFLSDRQMLNATFAMTRAKSNLRAARATMLEDALTLRLLIEARLGHQPLKSTT